MELQQVIEKRRTVRDFSGRPIDRKIVDLVLSAGYKAADAKVLAQKEAALEERLHINNW